MHIQGFFPKQGETYCHRLEDLFIQSVQADAHIFSHHVCIILLHSPEIEHAGYEQQDNHSS